MITITQMDLFKANKSHFFKIHEAYFLETKQGSMKHIIFIDALFKKKKHIVLIKIIETKETWLLLLQQNIY